MYAIRTKAQGLSTDVSAAANAGDLQAEVLALYDELQDRLMRYATSFGLSRHDAEDVLQEVFLALFRHLQLGRPRDNLHGWTYRTTHNLSLRRRASLHIDRLAPVPNEGFEQQLPDEAPSPEEDLILRERQHRLQAVMRVLPENDRVCLRLRAEGCRYREIASIAGISLGSVAASLARSFERLRRMDSR